MLLFEKQNKKTNKLNTQENKQTTTKATTTKQGRASDLAVWINKKDIRSKQRAGRNGKKKTHQPRNCLSEVKKSGDKMRIAKSQAELDL